MSEYTAKIAALEEAIASGELTVESDGERVTYRSISELIKARDFLVQRDVAVTAAPVRPATTVASYCPD